MQGKSFLLLFGSFALLTSTILVSGQSAKHIVLSKHTASPQTVANLLDKLVQPRFLQDAGKFGMDRLVIAGHEDQSAHGMETVYYLKPKNENETSLLRSANAAKRDYAIGFIHCAHKPGKFLPKSKTNSGSTTTSITPGNTFQTLVVHQDNKDLYDMPDGFETEQWNKRNWVGMNRVVKQAMARVKEGQGVDVNMARLFVALRPIKASQSSCLGCHRGAKNGDTLGIMAYAISTKE